jgi:hypothetical protein
MDDSRLHGLPIDTGSIEKADPDTRQIAMEILRAGVKDPIRQ